MSIESMRAQLTTSNQSLEQILTALDKNQDAQGNQLTPEQVIRLRAEAEQLQSQLSVISALLDLPTPPNLDLINDLLVTGATTIDALKKVTEQSMGDAEDLAASYNLFLANLSAPYLKDTLDQAQTKLEALQSQQTLSADEQAQVNTYLAEIKALNAVLNAIKTDDLNAIKADDLFKLMSILGQDGLDPAAFMTLFNQLMDSIRVFLRKYRDATLQQEVTAKLDSAKQIIQEAKEHQNSALLMGVIGAVGGGLSIVGGLSAMHSLGKSVKAELTIKDNTAAIADLNAGKDIKGLKTKLDDARGEVNILMEVASPNDSRVVRELELRGKLAVGVPPDRAATLKKIDDLEYESDGLKQRKSDARLELEKEKVFLRLEQASPAPTQARLDAAQVRVNAAQAKVDQIDQEIGTNLRNLTKTKGLLADWEEYDSLTANLRTEYCNNQANAGNANVGNLKAAEAEWAKLSQGTRNVYDYVPGAEIPDTFNDPMARNFEVSRLKGESDLLSQRSHQDRVKAETINGLTRSMASFGEGAGRASSSVYDMNAAEAKQLQAVLDALATELEKYFSDSNESMQSALEALNKALGMVDEFYQNQFQANQKIQQGFA